MINKMIACCGINCEKCETRIATIKDDDKMREEVSRKWCELFHTDIITPDKINCTGCRGDGVKYFFCNELCEIKPCVTSKGYESCAECAEIDSCTKLAAEIGNNEDASRAQAFELWMKSPMPMVTLTKTFDVTRLCRVSHRRGIKFNMLLCWCIGKTASRIDEFYLLPEQGKLYKYDRLAINVIVNNKGGGINSCDILYT